MPEEHWQAHGGIAACDLCHSRKVKCDRKEPCGNCMTTKVECLRTRHKRTARPKVRIDAKIQALVQRLSSLEESVQVNQKASVALSPSRDRGDTSTQGPLDEASRSPRPAKRKRTDAPVDSSAQLIPKSDATQGQTNDARSYLREELSHNGLLSVNQRLVLETAIDFVDQVSQAPSSSPGDRTVWNKKNYTSTDLSRGEILHTILGTQACPTRQLDQTVVSIRAVDHVPPRAFERIALTLLEGNTDEQTTNLHKVIVHFKACVVFYSYQMNGSPSVMVQNTITQQLLHHLDATCTALDQISFMVPPSLLLLQALISGAMLMQIIGDPSACWDLTASASRIVVALGYHTLRATQPTSELDEEIHLAVAWCCFLDRCMSLLLLRPMSLPRLNVPISSLMKPDPSNPMSIIDIIGMETTPVQEKILELTLNSRTKNEVQPDSVLKEEVALLRDQMAQIYASMEKARSTFPLEDNTDILLHFQSLEFKYFSTLTSVHRLSPTVTSNPLEREECLQCARRALELVKVIQENNIKSRHFVDVEYNPYLSWTILSYPLCPFFVLFCNVVGTSNPRDFQTLQDVTDGMSSLIDQNRYVMRLHRLCVTLLKLCKPLVMHGPHNTDSYTTIPEDMAAVGQDIMDASPANNSIFRPVTTSDPSGLAQADMGSSWNDDMMWQLFQSQPSLDWFNSDILDSTFGTI